MNLKMEGEKRVDIMTESYIGSLEWREDMRRKENLVSYFLVSDLHLLKESIDPFNDRDNKTEKEKAVLQKAIKVVIKDRNVLKEERFP